MYDGIIIICKEPGYTSFDVVAKLRGILRQKKIGHTGTLDPSAEGVLPVCLGTAAKMCEFLAGETKTYEAVLLLGRTTDTQDTDGKILSEKPVSCSAEEIRRAALSFQGEQLQVPPMYSALKKNGKKLYELARAGIEVEREPRKVVFYEIEVLSIDIPRVRLRVTCSRGTYIRTLCSDLGDRLGCGGCMEHLVRTRVGEFRLEDARKLADIQKLSEEGKTASVILPTDYLFRNLPSAVCSPEADRLVHNGNAVPADLLQIRSPEESCCSSPEEEHFSDGGGLSRADGCFSHRSPDAGHFIDMDREDIRVYDSEGQFIGIYRESGDRVSEEKKDVESVEVCQKSGDRPDRIPEEKRDGESGGQDKIYRVRRMFYRPQG